MLSKNHRLYKAFKEMKNKEKEIQKKKEKISWRGLDSPFIKIEIKKNLKTNRIKVVK